MAGTFKDASKTERNGRGSHGNHQRGQSHITARVRRAAEKAGINVYAGKGR